MPIKPPPFPKVLNIEYLSDKIFNALGNIPMNDIEGEDVIITNDRLNVLIEKYPDYAEFAKLRWQHGIIHPNGMLLVGLILAGKIDQSDMRKSNDIPGQWVWYPPLGKLIWGSRHNVSSLSTHRKLKYCDPDLSRKYQCIEAGYELDEERMKCLHDVIATAQGFVFHDCLLSTKKIYLIQKPDSKNDANKLANIEKIATVPYPCHDSTLFEVVSGYIDTANLSHYGTFVIRTFYRGHSQRYKFPLLPTCWRPNGWFSKLRQRNLSHVLDVKSWSSAIAHAQNYLTNVAVECISENADIHLAPEQAHAFLQHYMAFPFSYVFDVTESIDIAKWFALHDFKGVQESSECYMQNYVRKRWDNKFSHWSECKYNLSCIYVVSTIQELLPFPLPFVETTYDMTKQFCRRSTNQQAYCVPGCHHDVDDRGVIVNITELTYHPIYSPTGWDVINGPRGIVGSIPFDLGDDSTDASTLDIIHFLFPKEEKWLMRLLSDLHNRMKFINESLNFI